MLGMDRSYVQKSAVDNKPGVTRALHLFALGGGKSVVATEASSAARKRGQADNTIPVSKAYKQQSAALVVCDMPGYGFAYMKEEERERCENLIHAYLTQRGKSLKRVLLLLDARHGFKAADVAFLTNLYQYVREGGPTTDDNSSSSSSSSSSKQTQKAASMGSEREGTKNPRGVRVKGAGGKDRWPLRWKLQVVLTKCDLLERTDLARTLQEVRNTMFDIVPSRLCSDLPVMALSGLANKGA